MQFWDEKWITLTVEVARNPKEKIPWHCKLSQVVALRIPKSGQGRKATFWDAPSTPVSLGG